MPKVIGIDEKHIKHIGCRNCAAKLEYTLSEVTYSYTTDYGGGTDDYNYIKCPKCNANVQVKGY